MQKGESYRMWVSMKFRNNRDKFILRLFLSRIRFVLQQEKQGQGSAGRERTLWWRGGGVGCCATEVTSVQVEQG